MMRKIRNFLKSLLRMLFDIGQRMGFSILPLHFYSQIPDINALRKKTSWREPFSMSMVSGAAVEEQIEFLSGCCPENICARLGSMNIHETAIRENGEDAGYGPIEAELLYCFIHQHRPSKVLQIGCGVSTSVILRAARDAGYKPEVVCVEPFPTAFLQQANKQERLRLIWQEAQEVALADLTDLAKNDLLFVDSTHTVKPGSEVNRIVLEVLPRLAKGVWVHFHDIYFPYDYKRDILAGDLFFWSESTLLHAFLACNPYYTIRASMSMLHYSAPDSLKRYFRDYEPQQNDNGLRGLRGKHFPSATYLQRL